MTQVTTKINNRSLTNVHMRKCGCQKELQVTDDRSVRFWDGLSN